MIIDIIVILKCYLIFLFNRERGTPVGGVRIRYPCPNTDTLCFNTDTLYTLDKLYILLMNQSYKLQLRYFYSFYEKYIVI